jgi:hypothetical protein
MLADHWDVPSSSVRQRPHRPIGPSLRVPAPAAVSVRARLRVSDGDVALLTALGDHLGQLASLDLARAGSGLSITERKRQLTAVSSSRYAGAIVRANTARIHAAQAALVRQIADRKLAIAAIARRLTAPVGEAITDQHGQQITGYRSP